VATLAHRLSAVTGPDSSSAIALVNAAVADTAVRTTRA
jgi:hypothetical protein